MGAVYVGIDLAASPSKCTGYAAIVCEDRCELAIAKCVYSDDELISAIRDLVRCGALVVSIDAPFGTSAGMRDVDRKMISAGFKVLPPGFKHMKSLTLRCVRLVNTLRSLGISNLYETHPRSALLSSGCRDVEDLLNELSIGLGTHDLSRLTRDVRDALIASAVSYCLSSNCSSKVVGADGTVWLIDRVCED